MVNKTIAFGNEAFHNIRDAVWYNLPIAVGHGEGRYGYAWVTDRKVFRTGTFIIVLCVPSGPCIPHMEQVCLKQSFRVIVGMIIGILIAYNVVRIKLRS
jgi:hypothetical protein